MGEPRETHAQPKGDPRATHGRLMGDPWTTTVNSRETHGRPMGDPWTIVETSGRPMVSDDCHHSILIGYPWDSHERPMGDPCATHGPPLQTHELPMGHARGPPLRTHGRPMGNPWARRPNSWTAHGLPTSQHSKIMAFLWATHGATTRKSRLRIGSP